MIKNKAKSLKKTNDSVTSEVSGRQERNKTWWETLPMTYADWDSDRRIPKSKEDFMTVEKLLLNGNPFLINDFDFNKFKGKMVLEIGCGSGAASCLFAKGGADVTAVDITENAVKITKENAKQQGLKINVYQRDAEKLGFDDETFDYIFSWGVLHHSQNTIKAFRNVSRVLKKGGSGLIMVYNQNSLRYYLNGLNWLFLKGKVLSGHTLQSVQKFYTDGYYHRHFTPKELKRELEKLGLECNKISITHMGTKMVPFVPNIFRQWLKRRYGWLLVAEFTKKNQ